ncbi:DNA polymerase III subunit delta [Myroides marinus]|uniref:DNA polymerase III subunit delta n=1 Tax=Myroides marinus TaxID=703342 RepID=A0A1H6SPJ0_9FLAO|nr:DNA polymerase III subunit delta [Myroides marinus]MDR0195264.1 DNA polymerase III subunit delta [Myroides sp.]KUF43305.1 DNA polymerase III subunit delta [Myroides marinus]MDM1348771.1 DNA polymerase III subunit delta [Myroides marinus]MDM1349598.1 DNA polymerase III subunit delta [Myroides marinus]MDM1356807.1 DNA polymerase III subunit delta [Myroides marinus]
MDQVKDIIKDIKAGKAAPIYFLMGEEPYYIDKISEYIEDNVLTEEEKGFNQMVLYGRDVTIQDIVSNAKRFPLMAEKQVVIVKEAQELARTIDQIESYAEQVQPSTVLVFCYKYKTLDKRKKVYKTIEKNGIIFESKKLKEYQIEAWIKKLLTGKGYAIDPKASAMLVEFLGTDLSKIANELDKLALVIPKGVQITADVVEKNIGISKDFNNFELIKAIVDRNQLKAYKIANYFAQNPKNNPIVLTMGLVYSYFSKLLLYHGLKDKSPSNVMKQLKVSQYAIKDYEVGFRIYKMKQVSAIISHLKDVDLKSKGVGAQAMPQGDLLKEMLIKIFN